MNNIALGQYVDRDSIIHKLDARTKIALLIALMVAVFLIPSPIEIAPYISFIALGAFTFFIFVIVFCTKISLLKYLGSLKQIAMLVIFAFVVQIVSPTSDGEVLVSLPMNFSVGNVIIVVLLLVLFFVFRKKLPAKLLLFVILLVGSIYLFTIPIGPTFSNNPSNILLYKTGLYKGAFFSLRIFLVIMLSTILTLTTKPTDLTSALEWLLYPLTWFKLNVSVFAMMISLALRFIPTLFNETNKILKAQASRGVDFKEGNLKSQVGQIISLLIPMFVISYKRAEDLADAMEARGYIPGAKRTKLEEMKFHLGDLFSFIIGNGILIGFIVWKVIL